MKKDHKYLETPNSYNIGRDIFRVFAATFLGLALIVANAYWWADALTWMDQPRNQFTTAIIFTLIALCFGFYALVKYIERKV